MAKQKPIKITVVLAIAIGIVLLVAAVLWFKQYYDYRYVLEDYYYTIVPWGYDFTPEKVYTSNGEFMGLRSTYNLLCYNADGKERQLEFTVSLDMHDLYPPGTYVRVAASKQWATGKNALAESDVPTTALEKIKSSFVVPRSSSLAEYADERTGQLQARNTPSLKLSCALLENELLYTYTYSSGAQELAKEAAELLAPVYKAQFRADKEAFPELEAIVLEIKLDDGTVVFSNKYNEKVRFGYEIE
jgi:uncharacterized protein YxeA